MKKRRRESLDLFFVIFILFVGFGIIFVKYHLGPKELSPSPLLTQPLLSTPSLPKVAIILDDFGYNLSPTVKGLIELDYPLTLAILPKLSHTDDIATLAELSGKEVILHLPMEPHGYPSEGRNPGPGAIFCNLAKEEIAKRVRENLEELPQAVGLNNHMGSKAIEDSHVMSAVLDEVKKRNLYFVDSLTTSKSVGLSLARKKEIKSAGRDIFLDNKDDPVYINSQFDKLIAKAKKEGKAIGIGHAYNKAILDVLKDRLPKLKEEGIELVFASKIVE